MSDNVAIGSYAMDACTGTEKSVAVGYLAGTALTTGTDGVYIGYKAGNAETTGDKNVVIGYEALRDANGSGSSTCIGFQAGEGISTADYVIAVGRAAMGWTTSSITGHGNTHIAYATNPAAADTTGELIVGAGTNGHTGKGTNTGFINPSGGAVYQGNNSSTWSTTSDRRIKKNIVDNNIGLAAINQLRVRNFEYRTEEEIIEDYPELTDVVKSAVVEKEGLQVGAIAQEIKEILPDVVVTASTGVMSVDPDNLTWYLVNAVQELSAQNDALVARITALESN